MIAWIVRGFDDVVEAASMVAYTTPEYIKQCIDDGRTVELVDTGPDPLAINRVLPPATKVLQKIDSWTIKPKSQ